MTPGARRVHSRSCFCPFSTAAEKAKQVLSPQSLQLDLSNSFNRFQYTFEWGHQSSSFIAAAGMFLHNSQNFFSILVYEVRPHPLDHVQFIVRGGPVGHQVVQDLVGKDAKGGGPLFSLLLPSAIISTLHIVRDFFLYRLLPPVSGLPCRNQAFWRRRNFSFSF